jgi:hypothetical protein
VSLASLIGPPVCHEHGTAFCPAADRVPMWPKIVGSRSPSCAVSAAHYEARWKRPCRQAHDVACRGFHEVL